VRTHRSRVRPGSAGRSHCGLILGNARRLTTHRPRRRLCSNGKGRRLRLLASRSDRRRRAAMTRPGSFVSVISKSSSANLAGSPAKSPGQLAKGGAASSLSGRGPANVGRLTDSWIAVEERKIAEHGKLPDPGSHGWSAPRTKNPGCAGSSPDCPPGKHRSGRVPRTPYRQLPAGRRVGGQDLHHLFARELARPVPAGPPRWPCPRCGAGTQHGALEETSRRRGWR